MVLLLYVSCSWSWRPDRPPCVLERGCGGVAAASHRMGLLRRRYGVRSPGAASKRFVAAPARQTTFVLAAFRDVREASWASVDGGRTRDTDASDTDARQFVAANKFYDVACCRYATQQHVNSRQYSAPYSQQLVRAAL